MENYSGYLVAARATVTGTLIPAKQEALAIRNLQVGVKLRL
jgi:hypothetical protein